ncbi:Hypothetical protein CINCED_3A011191 [Cinara cedri]|nr:Hypothetical protein CINCED_3A011191 [Cinara cedri]
MLVVNIFKTLKLSSSFGRPIKVHFSTKINEKKSKLKRDSLFENKTKLTNGFDSNKDEKYNECIKNGLTLNVISTNNWLYDMHIVHLRIGLKLLHKWKPRHIDDLLLLLQLPMTRLSYLTRKTMIESNIVPQGNRVYYFADNFEKKPQETCTYMMHYKFLFTRHFLTVDGIFKLLMENKVNKNDIWKDAWIFLYSPDQILQRLTRTKEANIIPKPWMFRCPEKVFDRTLTIKQENRVILNKDSTAQYLAKRLKVTENKIAYISLKYPTILRVNPTKLKEILDFLLSEGYNSSEILNVPRVFTHSISTLQDRLTEIRDLNGNASITNLCKNKSSYQELIGRLIIKTTKESTNL